MASKKTSLNGDFYTDDIAESLIEWISEGKTLSSWCRLPGNPKRSTIYKWLNKHKDFADRLNIAREIGADAIADECLQIADTMCMCDTIEESSSGTKKITADALGHRKLQIYTRWQLASKWHPRRYGGKLELSGDKDNPVAVSTLDVSSLSTDVLNQIMAVIDAAKPL